MSKKSKDQDTAQTSPDVEAVSEDETEIEASDAESAAAAPEIDVDAEATPAPPEESPPKRGNWVAWVALLIAILALAGVGLSFVDRWKSSDSTDQSNSSIAKLDRQVEAMQESLENLASLDDNVAALSRADAELATRLESQQRDIGRRIQLLDSLPVRMSGIESSVAALQGVSAGTRDTWLLSEAEYYMQIANAQLQLASNPHLATIALRMADERIVSLGNPALIEVRTAVSDELAALDVMIKPDIEGMTMTLSSLARVVDSLPLRTAERGDSNVGNEAEDLSGVDRALASVKDAMSGLVKITPPDQDAAPLVAPDAVYFLRTNLTLQIQVARLALLRGETAVFNQSLDDASDWLRTYFDTESTQVAASLETIAEIRGTQFEMAPPDISNSLRLLRQFRALAEIAQ
jgi:uroporphyrin-3 C-methyltransferase